MAPFLIGLLLIGGGASLAAKSANPGDMLYGMKVGFNENIRSSLSFSDEAKAHWDAIRQSRRLDEAAELKAEGKLDAKAEAKLRERYDSYRKDYDKHMDELRKDDKRADAAVKLDADAQAMFSSRREAMGALGVTFGANATADQHSESGIDMKDEKDSRDANLDIKADGTLNLGL